MSKNRKHHIPSPNAGQLAIQQLIKQAEDLIDNKNIDQAIELLELAEQDHADNPGLQLFFGKTLIKEKSFIEGVKKLEDALSQHPEHIGLLLELGQTYLKPGDTKRANPYIQKALELAPNDPNTHLVMGSLAQRKGDLPLAVENYRKAIEIQLKYPTTKAEPEKKEDFETGKAENLLWNTLKLMAENGVHMFPSHGTLLGLTRNNQLFKHDKDIDTTVPYSEMKRAVRILLENGWNEIFNSFGYISPRAFQHKETGISLDVAGTVIDQKTGKAITGTWMPHIPKEWNIIREFNSIQLEKKPTPDNSAKVWQLKDPEGWLEAIYGNWKVPDKNFDTMICGKNSQSFSLLLKCFAFSRILSNWTNNNIPKALSITRATLIFDSSDNLIRSVLHRLEERRK